MDFSKQPILIYDLETAVTGSRPDGTKDEFRIFGCYSYLTNSYHVLTKPRLIKQMIDKHKYLVGFNSADYDNNILFRMPVVADRDGSKYDQTCYQGMYQTKKGSCGFVGKINIDLMQIFKKRASAMKIKKGMLADLLMHFSLSYIAKTIELGSYKDDNFDYSLLQEEVSLWSPEKKQLIINYVKQDLLVTKEMYEWLENYFESFKSFVSQENIENKSYLTCSTAVFAYKCLCKELGMEEEYGEAGLNADFGGGFVALPTVLEEHGDILLYDASSLYPSLFMMGNLFGDKCNCCNENEKWSGDNFFKVEGKYCSKELAPLGKVLRKFYLMRSEMKKNKDPREYSVKIIINSCFSGDTEILTTKGIKNIKDCKIGDIVYSLNKNTEQVELKPITDTQVFNYNKKMIHFKKKNIDLMVTPDHKMLFKKRKYAPIVEMEAQDFIKQKCNVTIPLNPIEGKKEDLFDMKQILPKTGKWYIKLDNPYSQRKNNNLKYNYMRRIHESLIGIDINLKGKWFFQDRFRGPLIPEYLPTKDIFYFIGMYLSEGCLYKSKSKHYNNGNYRGVTYRTQICQNKSINPIHYNTIQESLNNLKIRYSANKDGFDICSKFWYNFFKNLGKYQKDRYIPQWMFKYDSSLLFYLHKGLYDGDGNKKNYRYSTNSYKLRDDMIRLNLHLGYRCTTSYDSNCYRIFRTGEGLYLNQDKNFYSYIKNPENKVYCITVADNHTVYAGRNKKLSWVGQCYGAVSNSTFKNIYNPIAGSDCTALGRQVIRYARKRFREEGFQLLFTDTDGVGLKIVNGKTKDDANKVAIKLTQELLEHFPFPQDFFEFKIDAEITDIFFVKDPRKHTKEEFIVDGELDPDDEIMINKGEFYLKKNYLFIDTDGNVTYKNLNIKKKSVSALSRALFRDVLIPEIKKNKSIRFSREFIDLKIHELLAQDIGLAGIRYSVKDASEYKVEHQIQAQIARRYGSGIRIMVPNYSLGVGKKKRYCLLEEFIDNGFTINDLDLSGVYKELKYFIIGGATKGNTKKVSRKKKDFSQKDLDEWFK
jgi:DNA polymerase elongation subunit (family B)